MPGMRGVDGFPGTRGSNGPQGKVEFIIYYDMLHPSTYYWRYDLFVVDQNALSQKRDDIIEPGCWVDLFMTIQNVGGCPTPKYQVSTLLFTLSTLFNRSLMDEVSSSEDALADQKKKGCDLALAKHKVGQLLCQGCACHQEVHGHL